MSPLHVRDVWKRKANEARLALSDAHRVLAAERQQSFLTATSPFVGDVSDDDGLARARE